jgi:serine/threonine-protein kinase HipA
MARRSWTQTLALWANGSYVGRWTVNARGGMELQYDPARRASAVGRPLSLSLPFGLGDEPLKGPAVEHDFDKLLPDSPAIRRRVAERFRTGSVQAGLLNLPIPYLSRHVTAHKADPAVRLTAVRGQACQNP